MKMENVKKCVICGQEGVVLYDGLNDRYSLTDMLFTIKKCPSCGMLWLDPRVAAEDMAECYKNYFEKPVNRNEPPEKYKFVGRKLRAAMREWILCGYYGYRHLHGSHHWCWLGRLLGCFQVLRRKAAWDFDYALLPYKKGAPRRVIDVGCGAGGFLEFMGRMGWNGYGIEPDETAAQILAEKNIPFVKGTIENAGQELNESAELVTLFHVLEHIVDPAKTVEKCRQFLKKDGLLVVRVPNANSFAHTMFGSCCFHLDPPRHLFSFTIEGLVRVIKKSGFTNYTVTTRAYLAPSIYDHSVEIKNKGRTVLNKCVPQKGRKLFLLKEYLLLLSGHAVGEEILLIATK